MVEEQRHFLESTGYLCVPPRISGPLGARSVEQTILETASKIELAIFVEEWDI